MKRTDGWALCALLAACGGSTVAPPVEEGPRIHVFAGDQQQAVPGSTLPLRLRARVLDSGEPVPGLMVTWSTGGSGGTVEPLGALTDAEGVAHAQFTLGEALGQYTVIATADGVPGSATFTALATDTPTQGATLVATVPVPAIYGHHDTFVRDGLAFVSAWNAGVLIYDVGNGRSGGSPANPRLVTEFVPASNGVPGGAQVHNAWWFHNPNTDERRYLFVGQEGPGIVGLNASGDLHVLDVSDLEHPVEVASLRIPGAGVHNFWMDEAAEILYAAWYNGGVVAIDVSGTLSGNLQNRIIRRGYPGGEGNAYTWGVMKSGNTVYAADMVHGLTALDPATLIARHPTPTVSDYWTSDLWIHGSTGYTGTWGNRTGKRGDALHIWSLAGNGVPSLVRTLELPGVGTLSDVAVSPDGRFLVVTAEGGSGGGAFGPGLYVFDRVDPRNPQLLSRVDVGEGLHTGEVAEISGRTYVFAAKNPGAPAMLVFDITDLR